MLDSHDVQVTSLIPLNVACFCAHWQIYEHSSMYPGKLKYVRAYTITAIMIIIGNDMNVFFRLVVQMLVQMFHSISLKTEE